MLHNGKQVCKIVEWGQLLNLEGKLVRQSRRRGADERVNQEERENLRTSGGQMGNCQRAEEQTRKT